MSIDSYDEFCVCHPRMRTFGRLMNWARAGTVENNVECVPYHLQSLGNYHENVPRGIMFDANRKILPLEEIRYDYGDKACVDLFQPEKQKPPSHINPNLINPNLINPNLIINPSPG